MPPGGLGEMISPRPPQSGGTVFRAETLRFFSTKHSTAVPSESVVPLFISWNGKRPPLVFLHAEPEASIREQSAAAPVVFMRNRETSIKE